MGCCSKISAAGVGLVVFLAACSGVPPSNLGVTEGRFAPCPPTPNCVSSQSPDKEHAIEPLRYRGSAPQAMADLRKIILGMNRARIVKETETYLHAEFTSAIFRFVDDAEFFLDEPAKEIQVRSAARVGSYDFGVNRRRMERIRAAWERLGNP